MARPANKPFTHCAPTTVDAPANGVVVASVAANAAVSEAAHAFAPAAAAPVDKCHEAAAPAAGAAGEKPELVGGIAGVRAEDAGGAGVLMTLDDAVLYAPAAGVLERAAFDAATGVATFTLASEGGLELTLVAQGVAPYSEYFAQVGEELVAGAPLVRLAPAASLDAVRLRVLATGLDESNALIASLVASPASDLTNPPSSVLLFVEPGTRVAAGLPVFSVL
jgi:hypothetical protein